MGFRVLLLVLGWRLQWLASHREAFRNKLAKRQVIMQWRTFDGAPARWFHFQESGVTCGAGLHANPSVTLEFRDADFAFTTLKAAGANQMIFMQAMQAGDIKIKGDAAQLMWFMSLMKHIVPKKTAKKASQK